MSYLALWRGSRLLLAAVAILPAAATLALTRASIPYNALLSRETIILAVATGALIMAYALVPGPRPRQAVMHGLLLLTLWDPAGRLLLRGFTNEAKLESSLQTAFAERANAFLYENEPAAFLAARSAEEPARYAGFAPSLLPDAESALYKCQGADRFTIDVDAGAPALLSLSEIWDPGWTATVDGSPAPVYQMNYIFQGIAVPSGRHLVNVRYSPPYLRLGMGISGGAVILLSLVAVTLYRREIGATAREAAGR